jgi:hypothetical protein
MDREAYNNAPVILGSQKVWFLNNCLVRKYHFNRSNGIMSVFNITKDQIESCLISDFKKNRERAYSVKETAMLVNRHQKHLYRLIYQNILPPPMGASRGGERAWRTRAYYSESKVKEIRDILAMQHIGRPRKDGLITNDITPTTQELTRRMGDGILTYTRTEDGNFVPVWAESI